MELTSLTVEKKPVDVAVDLLSGGNGLAEVNSLLIWMPSVHLG